MINEVRLEKLVSLLRKEQIDAIFLAPSSDLEYVTGMRLHPDSRFKGVMISAAGGLFALCPSLYRSDMEEKLGKVPIHVWEDGRGFVNAFREGAAVLGVLDGKVAFNGGVRAVDMLEAVAGTKMVCVSGVSLSSSLRRRKDAGEMELMRKASKHNDAMIEKISKYIRPGLTEKQIAKMVMAIHEEQGGQPRYPIVGSGPNGANPHYSGDKDRTITEQDVVVVDSGAWYQGYSCDMTRTFCVGEPTEEQRKVYGIVLEAQCAGEAAARRGAIPEKVDAAARSIIAKAGYGEAFFNRVGHGTGMDPHEDPFIVAGNTAPLEVGDCFSIEPGIYLNGEFGVRIENLVMITEAGTEILNSFPKAMMIL